MPFLATWNVVWRFQQMERSLLKELRKQERSLAREIARLKKEIKEIEKHLEKVPAVAEEPRIQAVESSIDPELEAPKWCVPIKADVRSFDWDVGLDMTRASFKQPEASSQQRLSREYQFDVILMDPPWQLASHAPTRGVAITYQQLPDSVIEELPIPKLQKNGFIFIWVINNKYLKAFELMEKWGYTYVDDITWVKQTVNRRLAKGHGYYLQHAKETCLVGLKGKEPGAKDEEDYVPLRSISSDVIFSERRGQSQKPEELYEMIEELVPNGKYLEIFGRKNNLRDFWVTIGNEL